MPYFSAPLVVAGRAELTPDGAPLVLYLDSLGAYPGGLAATVAPSGATPPPRISFSDLLTTIRVLESSGRIPDLFLESLRGSFVFSVEHDFAIGGDLLVESLRGFRARFVDPVSPLPGPSQGGDSVSRFLYSLVGGFTLASPSVAGVADVCFSGVSGVGVSPTAVISSLFSLPTAPFIPVSRPLLPPLGFLPISPLFPPVSLSFHPFLPPDPPAVASSSSSFSVSSLLLPPVSSAMPSFPVPSVSALPHLSSLGCFSALSFASLTLSCSVASWSSPSVVSSFVAAISSFPWPVVPPVSSVPPFATPPLTFPVLSVFAPAPVPSNVASSSSSLPPPRPVPLPVLRLTAYRISSDPPVLSD